MPLPRENFKVFISHATIEDGELANWIADTLDSLHIRAFVYERYQRGGQNRFDVIKELITACPYFLVILTKAGIASQWVNQEIGYAAAQSKKLIPVVEVDTYTGRLIESKGFVELHDPIHYSTGHQDSVMISIIYAFSDLIGAQNSIYLSCKCGYEFEGNLGFAENWSQWISIGQPFPLTWSCANCGRQVTAMFPTCQILPQQD